MTERNGTCTEDPGKRLAILEQAIRIFAELGFRGSDVQVIADRAGVGKGTIYRYFGSKEDLFWATTHEMMLRMEQHVFAATEGVEGAIAKLRAAAMAHAAFFESNPHYTELCVQDRAEFRGSGPESHQEHYEKMIAKMSGILQQGIKSGELRPLDTRLTTLALGNLLFGSVVFGCRTALAPVQQMAEYGVEILLRGLRAESSCGAMDPDGQELHSVEPTFLPAPGRQECLPHLSTEAVRPSCSLGEKIRESAIS
jgi:AcrR family transcriptional regulator